MIKYLVYAAAIFVSFPAFAGGWKWAKIGTVVLPGIGTLVGAAIDAGEDEIQTRENERRERRTAERRAQDAEVRNSLLERELEELRESYRDKVDELDAHARKEDVTHTQKVDLDIALEAHKSCLRNAESPSDVRDCYRIYKKKYDEITDIW